MKLRLSQKVSQRQTIKRRLIYVASFTLLAGIVGTFIFFYSNIGVTHNVEAGTATSISGVINSYLRVTAVTASSNQFVADNLSGSIADFQPGKKIIIYQAKGATITTSNTSSYGTITSYNNAGNYEFTKVAAISGSGPYTITVSTLLNSYTATGSVQLVSVPQYTDVSVTGTVIPLAWNSTQGRGGIIALEATGTVTLGASFVASGYGFAGGSSGAGSNSCPDNTTYVSASSSFAEKGEGIASFTVGQYGRGPQANGGGGGNPRNAGGGGGSNYSVGGTGGQGDQPGGACSSANASGIAGNAYAYSSSTTKLFFGGGGGSGEKNNGVSAGGNGGGIVIVRANTVSSTCGAFGFFANGSDAANTSSNDGSGGGGAGGVVVLDVRNYSLTCTVSASANGGNGGNITNNSAHGGGGAGGGIGVIFEVTPPSSSYKSYASVPGANGMDCKTCTTTTGTLPGTATNPDINTNASLVGLLSALPVKLTSFTGTEKPDGVLLAWSTASEKNNDHFTVERSVDGHTFEEIREVKGAGNSMLTLRYAVLDANKSDNAVYYRLKQTDFDGKTTDCGTIFVSLTTPEQKEISIYPNPASIQITIANPEEKMMDVEIVNDHGGMQFRHSFDGASLDVSTYDWPDGVYIAKLHGVGGQRTFKLVVRH